MLILVIKLSYVGLEGGCYNDPLLQDLILNWNKESKKSFQPPTPVKRKVREDEGAPW